MHPQRLFSSNVIDPSLNTNGVSLVYHREKVYFLHLDDQDQLAMQVVAKIDKDQGYGFKKLQKVGHEQEAFEEVKHKALVKFEERPRIVLRKTSVEYPAREMPSSTIGDFRSESLELDSIQNGEDHRVFVDVRRKVRKLAEDKPKLNFKVPAEAATYAKYLERTKKIMDEEPIDTHYGTPRGRELLYLHSIFDKEDLQMAKSLSNERYYITKQGINILKEKY